MATLDDINPAVLTGQGLPNSNPFSTEEKEVEEDEQVDAFAAKKREKVKKAMNQTDYLDDLLKKAEATEGDEIPVDDEDF